MNTIILLLILIAIINMLYVMVKSYALLFSLERRSYAKQSEEIQHDVQVQKTKKKPMEAVKRVIRGRSVTQSEDLMDLSEMDYEEGMKALEEYEASHGTKG